MIIISCKKTMNFNDVVITELISGIKAKMVQ